ncbi:MAG: glycine cleavage system protein GcvH [candidate division Zixibacteria bacterium]|nr:glycine cleavage system protein GcvH [candidate division Zixibacteria bacterium]
MIKEDLKYTKEHEWLRIESDEVIIGITDFAQGELGDIVFLELPSVGTKVSAGDSMGTIEAVKTVAELYAPVTGEITAVNDQLADNAALVNSDCYGDGWMVKIRMDNAGETDQLLSPQEYKQMTEA